MYTHTILVPKVLVFRPEYIKCPYCHEMMERHIFCEGARFHVHSYSTKGISCSQPNCEDNHGLGRCKDRSHKV